MALGPGLGPGRQAFVDALLVGWDRPLVLDADAIAAAGMDGPGRAAPSHGDHSPRR